MAEAMSGSGRLTTHVLDTARGVPAAGLALALHRIAGGGLAGGGLAGGGLAENGLAGGGRELVAEARTNADGRCDRPLMEGEAFRPGTYELTFACGAYLDGCGLALPEPKFLDEVVLRFGIAENRHYHVPLLLSPFGYSTYRGS